MLPEQKYGRYIQVWESNHVEDFQKIYNFAGKDVLEVGGVLPKSFVNELGVKSWTCIDLWPGIDYDDGNYRIINGNICDHKLKENTYDIIFSTNSFEHISDLEAAFLNMHKALKPQGLLSALFGPIWSSNKGHHLWFPNEQQDWITFNENPISDWSHLAYKENEIREIIKDKYSPVIIDDIMDKTYYNSIINRLFYEDYVRIINDSPFLIHELRNWHSPIKPDINLQKLLEENYPGKKNFSTRSLKILLQKIV